MQQVKSDLYVCILFVYILFSKNVHTGHKLLPKPVCFLLIGFMMSPKMSSRAVDQVLDLCLPINVTRSPVTPQDFYAPTCSQIVGVLLCPLPTGGAIDSAEKAATAEYSLHITGH